MIDLLPMGVLVLAAVFTFTIGFHDACDATATVQASGALTRRVSVMMAAVANLLGALFLVEIVGGELVDSVAGAVAYAPPRPSGLIVPAAALAGATVWNLLTWWRCLPSSSTHALVGGFVGAAIGAGVHLSGGHLEGLLARPLLLSPVFVLVVAPLLLWAVLSVLGRMDRTATTPGASVLLSSAAAATALLHGAQNSAKTAGIALLAMTAMGWRASGDDTVPVVLVLVLALSMAVGTALGGQRITATVVDLAPLDLPGGLAAQVATVLALVAAVLAQVPISTTYALVGALVVVGAVRRPRLVHWGTVGRVVLTWVLTAPAAGVLAALLAFAGTR